MPISLDPRDTATPLREARFSSPQSQIVAAGQSDERRQVLGSDLSRRMTAMSSGAAPRRHKLRNRWTGCFCFIGSICLPPRTILHGTQAAEKGLTPQSSTRELRSWCLGDGQARPQPRFSLNEPALSRPFMVEEWPKTSFALQISRMGKCRVKSNVRKRGDTCLIIAFPADRSQLRFGR